MLERFNSVNDKEAVLEVICVWRGLQYRCKCRSGYWHAAGGGWLGGAGAPLACAACGLASAQPACSGEVLHATLLALNLTGMLVCLIIALIIFRKRKCKVSGRAYFLIESVIVLRITICHDRAQKPSASTRLHHFVSQKNMYLTGQPDVMT